MEFHPSIVCLTETHLYDNVSDSFCPPGYVVAARRNRSKHGGGVPIIMQESILFKEIDTTAIAIAELVAIIIAALIQILMLVFIEDDTTKWEKQA